MSEDVQIECCDCKQFFLFAAGEQEFYASKQLTPPKRCKACRAAKKARREGGQQRQMQDHGGYGSHQVPGVHEENVPMNGAADYL